MTTNNSMEPLERIESLIEAVASKPLVEERKKARKPYRQDIRTSRRKNREYRSKRKEIRREQEDILSAQFYKLRRTYKSKGWLWDMELGEWYAMWSEVPAVEAGINTYKPAWMMRGKTKDSVQVKRLDTNQSFNINNLEIKREDEVLWSSIGF